MLSAIRALFSPDASETSEEESDGPDALHLAACALLLDLAYADGEFTEPEREHLQDVLARHFGLSGDAGLKLIELAEKERLGAIDHFRFTSILKKNYDIGQKMVLAEVMWGLVLSDGEIADHEHYLARKIANLLDLEPGYLSSAKQAAVAKSASRNK